MPTVRTLLLQVGLAVVYIVAGSVGLLFAFAHPSASPVWAPSGIAIAAGILWGSRAWPAVFAGAFVVNIGTAGTILTSLGIAVGNLLEAVIASGLVMRWANGRRAFERARPAFLFVLLAGGVAPLVAATVGVGSLALGGFVSPAFLPSTWITWWLGDAVGALMVAPAILLWTGAPTHRLTPAELAEAAGLGVGIILAGVLVFTDASSLGAGRTPTEFVAMPLLMWAAFRFGPREAVAALLLLSTIAIAGTLDGHGPFAVGEASRSLLLLQGFLGVAAATTLVVAAAMTQRRRAEDQLREWSVTDPLTGLGNYRQLVGALEREIQRSGRTERPFAVLLLDLDDLKRINDSEGHLVGSRALCRVGDELRRNCRTLDTPTRYGGDEFAVVLPESDEGEALQLARRVAAGLAADREHPRLTASMGVSVFPRDGGTMEELVRTADERMYADKRARTRPRTPVRTPTA